MNFTYDQAHLGPQSDLPRTISATMSIFYQRLKKSNIFRNSANFTIPVRTEHIERRQNPTANLVSYRLFAG